MDPVDCLKAELRGILGNRFSDASVIIENADEFGVFHLCTFLYKLLRKLSTETNNPLVNEFTSLAGNKLKNNL